VNLFLNGLVSLLKRQRSEALNSDKLLIATGLVCRYDRLRGKLRWQGKKRANSWTM
jgi:hypothetical protein